MLYITEAQKNPTQGAVWEFRAKCCMERIVQHNTKVFPASKIGQVWSSQQHTQTGNPDPSAWQIALIMVLPWHVSAASSSGVTFLSATLRGFISFCKGKTLHVTWTEVSRSKIVIPEKNNLF